MKNEQTRQWTAGLRSRMFTQGKGHLANVKRIEDGIRKDHCCLGVAAEMSGVPKSIDPGSGVVWYGPEHEATILPRSVTEWLGLKWDRSKDSTRATSLYLDADYPLTERPYRTETLLGEVTLDTMNDEWGLTFDQIADLIDYFGVEMVSIKTSQRRENMVPA